MAQICYDPFPPSLPPLTCSEPLQRIDKACIIGENCHLKLMEFNYDRNILSACLLGGREKYIFAELTRRLYFMLVVSNRGVLELCTCIA